MSWYFIFFFAFSSGSSLDGKIMTESSLLACKIYVWRQTTVSSDQPVLWLEQERFLVWQQAND